MFAGAAAAPQLGPPLARSLAEATGWNAWAGDAACWAAVYLGVTVAVSAGLSRFGATRATRRFHPGGAVLGGVAGGLIGWVALGNFGDVVLDQLPADTSAESAGAVRRPFEILRACRVLRSLSADEAQRLCGRPDVQAVIGDESFAVLFRTPGLHRLFARAAEGDWVALAALAADPQVKDAMSETEFVRRVQAVDVVALAADVERRRNGPPTPADEEPVAVRLPANFDDAETYEPFAAAWLAQEAPGLAEDVPPAIDADSYWRNVGRLIEVVDRPQGPAAWLPRLVIPRFDGSPPKSAAAEPGRDGPAL
jgi:hypothetical protein